ncbi:MAG: malonyl-CoA decarboxylase family protein, partial [Verrucomicrobiota bacterium]
WFNRGFLTLQPIDWNSSAAVLEKIIQYESVHEITGWGDLRSRLLPDRRCFAFFHPAMDGDPIIFVEVALTKGLAHSIPHLIGEHRPEIPPSEADTATFYSISNCHRGLRGIGFGNFLIKQVVTLLRNEFPQLRTFATLSPIPGFRHWFEQHPTSEGEDSLEQACAQYLMHGTDPVARFHLGNGAELERINLNADPSERGIAQSYGLMVNYLYDPKHIEQNHEAFVSRGQIITSKSVRKLLRQRNP